MENIISSGFAPKQAIFIYDPINSGFRGASIHDFVGKATTVSNTTPSGNAWGTCILTNKNRKNWFIQNLSTGIVYVKHGAGASSVSYNYLLKSNSSLEAGDGGTITDSSFLGDISISGSNAMTLKYIAFEMV